MSKPSLKHWKVTCSEKDTHEMNSSSPPTQCLNGHPVSLDYVTKLSDDISLLKSKDVTMMPIDTPWKVYCANEKQYIQTTSAQKPTSCPNDDQHAIVPLYTTLLCRVHDTSNTNGNDDPVTTGVREFRWSPSTVGPMLSITPISSIWEKLFGFTVSLDAHVLSISAVSNQISPNTTLHLRLYEPTLAQEVASLSWTGEEASHAPLTTVGDLHVTEGIAPFSNGIRSPAVYLEVQAQLGAGHIQDLPVTEIIIRWKE